MSQRYVGASGAYYTIIEPALGKGGEGSVYKVSEKPNYVLKLYNDKNKMEDLIHEYKIKNGYGFPKI